MTSAPAVGATVKLWSVTTLIRHGLGTSGGLNYWGRRFVAETAVEQLAAVTAMVSGGDPQGAIEYLAKAPDRHSRVAMQRGTRLHSALEAIALGRPPVLDGEIRPYVEQYQRWLDANQPEFLMAEAPVYNPAEHYAGTCDGVLRIASSPLYAFDYKSTEHPPDGEKHRPPFPENALQLCAYSRATHVGVLSEQRYSSGRRYYLFDPEADHEPMPQVEGALTIVVSPYDCFAVPTQIDERVWEAFLYVREAARWQIATSQDGIFGAPLGVPTTERKEDE